jgi:fermentation-respiration switch protein FrsA (DUF1100 family)
MRENSRTRVAINFVIGIVACAAILVALVRWLEPRFAFFPSPGEQRTPADHGAAFDAATLATADGEQLRAWTLTHPQPRARIVYFHGNGGNLSVWAPILAGVWRRGYEVRAIDYRGYGASSGRPTERGLYRDVDATVEWAHAAKPGVPIIYWGRSLGSTMAAYGATRRRPDGLILESGFRDAWSLLRASPPMAFLSLFSSYRFPTAAFANAARCPVLVVHGDADGVIPFAAGRALFEAISEPKQFVELRGGDHNDLVPADASRYWSAIDDFIARAGHTR